MYDEGKRVGRGETEKYKKKKVSTNLELEEC